MQCKSDWLNVDDGVRLLFARVVNHLVAVVLIMACIVVVARFLYYCLTVFTLPPPLSSLLTSSSLVFTFFHFAPIKFVVACRTICYIDITDVYTLDLPKKFKPSEFHRSTGYQFSVFDKYRPNWIKIDELLRFDAKFHNSESKKGQFFSFTVKRNFDMEEMTKYSFPSPFCGGLGWKL